MNNPYKVEIVGMDGSKKIWGVMYKESRLSGVGFPESWGTKTHATKYMAECLLCIPWKEWKANY